MDRHRSGADPDVSASGRRRRRSRGFSVAANGAVRPMADSIKSSRPAAWRTARARKREKGGLRRHGCSRMTVRTIIGSPRPQRPGEQRPRLRPQPTTGNQPPALHRRRRALSPLPSLSFAGRDVSARGAADASRRTGRQRFDDRISRLRQRPSRGCVCPHRRRSRWSGTLATAATGSQPDPPRSPPSPNGRRRSCRTKSSSHRERDAGSGRRCGRPKPRPATLERSTVALLGVGSCAIACPTIGRWRR